jgi:hypothetical protein
VSFWICVFLGGNHYDDKLRCLIHDDDDYDDESWVNRGDHDGLIIWDWTELLFKRLRLPWRMRFLIVLFVLTSLDGRWISG